MNTRAQGRVIDTGAAALSDLASASPPELLIKLHVNVCPHGPTAELLRPHKRLRYLLEECSCLMAAGYCHAAVTSDMQVQRQERDLCRASRLSPPFTRARLVVEKREHQRDGRSSFKVWGAFGGV